MGSLLPVVWGMHLSNKEVKNQCLWKPGHKPPELLWESQTKTQDTETIQQEAMFYCASTDSVD
jgi:hypothetical protein